MEPWTIQTHDRSLKGFTKETEGKWRGPFCFLQAADTQFGMMDVMDGKTGVDNTWSTEVALAEQSVAAANRMTPRPRFFVVCGDLVDAMPGDANKSRQEADFKQVYARLHPDIPLVCVCGNHDIGNTPTNDSVAAYRRSFGDDYFSFWVGGVKFIVVNSQYFEDDSQVEQLSANQESWLDHELADVTDATHLVVFQHIPPFTETPDEPKQYFNFDIPTRQNYLQKLKHAGVRALFCGHYHRNAGGFDENLEIVITSAIGAQLGSDQHGMRLVCVRESAIDHQYYSLEAFPTAASLGGAS